MAESNNNNNKKGGSISVKDGIVSLSVENGDDASSAEVYLFGAHVTSWEEKGRDPYLFLSENAILDGSKAIRGGIPVCFPQFSNLGKMKAHGFARISTWTLVEEESKCSDSTASITLRLTPNEESKAMWPSHDFQCDYTVELNGALNSSLNLSFNVQNKNKEAAFSFTTALHTYFSVGAIENVAVTGVQGLKYLDQLTSKTHEQKSDSVIFDREVDAVYYDTPTLTMADSGRRRQCTITTKGMPDAVIWNPWIAKAAKMGDFGDEEYKVMCCVEAAGIAEPIEVKAGSSWTGLLSMQYTVPASPNL